MVKLATKKCRPCEGGQPPLNADELFVLKNQLDAEAPGWTVQGGKRLEKEFRFKDFRSALAFVTKIGAIAESEGHHPNIELGWGFVRVMLWTHAIDGLSDNDFILAAKLG